jgi:hypothetical protein
MATAVLVQLEGVHVCIVRAHVMRRLMGTTVRLIHTTRAQPVSSTARVLRVSRAHTSQALLASRSLARTRSRLPLHKRKMEAEGPGTQAEAAPPDAQQAAGPSGAAGDEWWLSDGDEGSDGAEAGPAGA